MRKRTVFSSFAIMAVGGLLGFLAANSGIQPKMQAAVSSEGSNLESSKSNPASSPKSKGVEQPAAGSSNRLNRADQLALVNHNANVAAAQAQGGTARKPNILVIFGDDIGVPQISAYTMGMMGYKTPNIDRIAKEGAISRIPIVRTVAPLDGPLSSWGRNHFAPAC